MNHNNMTAFFSNNTNGSLNNYNHKLFHSYTGSGTYDIEKNEVAQLFKPLRILNLFTELKSK